MSNNIPAQNQIYKNVNGLNVIWASNTTLTVSAGSTRDSLNNNDIVLGSSVTINGAVNGAAGLDTGTLAASTIYYIYVIGSSLNLLTPSAVISANATAPTLPASSIGGNIYQYDTFQRVGYAFTDGSTHFINFIQTGNGLLRNYMYVTPISVLSGGSSATFAAVSLAGAVPPVYAIPTYLNFSYTPAVAANTFSIRPTGSTTVAASCPIVLSGVVAAKAQNFSGQKILPLISGANASIDYVVTASDALSITVFGYDDYIV